MTGLHECDRQPDLDGAPDGPSGAAKARSKSGAAAVWASVDRQLTDQAVWVPTVTLRDIEITSRRLRNYEFNPVWGFLADQCWLQ